MKSLPGRWTAVLTLVLIWSPLGTVVGAEISPASYGTDVHSHSTGSHLGGPCCLDNFNPWAGYCQEPRGLHLFCRSCMFQNLLCQEESDCYVAAPVCAECASAPVAPHLAPHVAPHAATGREQTGGQRLSRERRQELELIRQRLADPREEHFGPIIVSPPFASSIDVPGNDSGVPRMRVKVPASASPLVDGDRGRIDAKAAGAVGKMVARILFRSIMVGAVQAARTVDESGALPLDEGSPFEGDDGADEADVDDLFGP